MDRAEIEQLKRDYPAGTKVRLTADMEDPYEPIPEGAEGVVTGVDDIGSIHTAWSCGPSLALIPGLDRFEKTT